MKGKRVIAIVLLSLLTLGVTGCVGVKERTEDNIKAYNEEVYEVVRYVSETEKEITKREEEILKELQKETAIIDGVYIEGAKVIEGATEIDILRNEFFTSLNAESIRQVLVITKGGKGMYVELIWKENKLEKGIRRAVKI